MIGPSSKRVGITSSVETRLMGGCPRERRQQVGFGESDVDYKPKKGASVGMGLSKSDQDAFQARVAGQGLGQRLFHQKSFDHNNLFLGEKSLAKHLLASAPGRQRHMGLTLPGTSSKMICLAPGPRHTPSPIALRVNEKALDGAVFTRDQGRLNHGTEMSYFSPFGSTA